MESLITNTIIPLIRKFNYLAGVMFASIVVCPIVRGSYD